MPFENLYNKIVAIEEFDIVEETREILINNQEYLLHLLKNQLQLGKDGNGEDILLIRKGLYFDFYSEKTIDLKEEYGFGLGSITNRVTDYFTGTFYNSIYIVISGTSFQLLSDVSYFEDILSHRKGGDKIMELNNNSLSIFQRDILIPQLKERFNLTVNGLWKIYNIRVRVSII